MQNNSIAVVALVVLILASILASQAFVTVESGTVGVVTRFGAVQEGTLEPGLATVLPMVTRVVPVETRIKKIDADAEASSKDLQIVTSKVTLNYRVDRASADELYEQLGPEYEDRNVVPALQESIKATAAQYTAEELITKRSDVARQMKDDLSQRLADKYLEVTDLSIVEFNFSKEFNDAIEQKQVAQQAALRAQNELDRVRIEADQAVAEAKGKADAELERARGESESQKLLRDTVSAEILQLRFIEAWDGKLPVYSGGDLPALLVPTPSPALK